MTPPGGAVRPHPPGHSPKLTALKKYSDQWDEQRQAGDGVLDNMTARMLTTQIKQSATRLWELIVEAYQGKAWSALGYTSWDAYCTKEFQHCRLRLPREERTEGVASLRESELSIRAIASATGLGRGTVEREIAPVPNGTPDVEQVDAEIAEDHATTGDADIASYVAPDATTLPNNVIGLDSKRYPAKSSRPQPEQPPRRKPITDQFRDATYDLEKVMNRLVKLAGDDRFARNRRALAEAHFGDMQRMSAQLDDITDKLEDEFIDQHVADILDEFDGSA